MNVRNLCLGLVSFLVLVSLLGAQERATQKGEIKNVPIANVAPTDGKAMYDSYCASCHGTGGRGNGPASASLKIAPTDLTTLTMHNKGIYPDLHVSQTIRGDATYPAHGSKDMPVWGTAFRSLQFDGDPSADVERRVSVLNNYIASLQEK